MFGRDWAELHSLGFVSTGNGIVPIQEEIDQKIGLRNFSLLDFPSREPSQRGLGLADAKRFTNGLAGN
jgi:hypothetical protein